MRFAAQKKPAEFQDRAGRLRKARTAAPTLREVSPSATQMAVRLQFPAEAAPGHAEQSFVFYPGARAFFSFPCPYGDCDGIYDLSRVAESTLERSTPRAAGTLECSGARACRGMSAQLCGLAVSYTVTTEHGP